MVIRKAKNHLILQPHDFLKVKGKMEARISTCIEFHIFMTLIYNRASTWFLHGLMHGGVYSHFLNEFYRSLISSIKLLFE